jgi:hypothetical protein
MSGSIKPDPIAEEDVSKPDPGRLNTVPQWIRDASLEEIAVKEKRIRKKIDLRL